MRYQAEYPWVMEGTQRLEAFSDGVFAISITLLAVSLKLPDSIRNSFADAILSQWPQYLVFFISFLNVGVVWANHHEMFRVIKRSNHVFLLINLFLLMFIVLMPYSTSMLGEYLKSNSNQMPATVFYSGTLFGMSIMFNAVWLYAVNKKFIDERHSSEAIGFMTRSHLLVPLVFGTGFILTFISYPLTLIIITFASLLFLLPSRSRPIYLPQVHLKSAGTSSSKNTENNNKRRDTMRTVCSHLNQIKNVEPSTEGCEDCLRMGDTWVHLRECLTCGHVGCCDSSKNKHATQHFRQTHHPIVQSVEPGENWLWCYEDQVMMEPSTS